MVPAWLIREKQWWWWWVLAQQSRLKAFALHDPSAPNGMRSVRDMRTGLLFAILCCLGEVVA